MSRIFLLRHAQSIANEKGFLAGRMENIYLSKAGMRQRDALAERFEGVEFDQIISSPMQRCRETIEFLGSEYQIADEFQEVDYGQWTGKKMSSLMRNRSWREIHTNPASVRFPSGETLPEVQTRALLGLDMHLNSKAKNILISTHADVVKVLILHALGTHLNNVDKVQINNVSVSILEIDPKNRNNLHVIRVNDDTSKIASLLK